ncbi:hypothetical protein MXMO3_01746 [Maritalea myrionectae]|uniref:Uncharacterized protein n=1 Tax=Maritalea myrionectae TaxID=454601 RepID=A0A2R4ME40_9HYPH|nr:hypothetical protein [Maritalea myrionectae]AVX04272.1 hypothetical protein MXMO3_01746 [Maritalea myrionectae]
MNDQGFHQDERPPQSDSDRGGLSAFLPAMALMVVMFGFGVVGLAKAPDTGEMAVVFPPFQSEADYMSRIVASGAYYVAPSRIANIHVVKVNDATTRARLGELGALFFLAANGICGPISDEKSWATAAAG